MDGLLFISIMETIQRLRRKAYQPGQQVRVWKNKQLYLGQIRSHTKTKNQTYRFKYDIEVFGIFVPKNKRLMAYCLKSKRKEIMLEAKIFKRSNGTFVAQGITTEGYRVSLMMSSALAVKYTKNGAATKMW